MLRRVSWLEKGGTYGVVLFIVEAKGEHVPELTNLHLEGVGEAGIPDEPLRDEQFRIETASSQKTKDRLQEDEI